MAELLLVKVYKKLQKFRQFADGTNFDEQNYQ